MPSDRVGHSFLPAVNFWAVALSVSVCMELPRTVTTRTSISLLPVCSWSAMS